MNSSTSAVLYVLTTSVSTVSPLPDGAKEKSHHAKDGFTNPWESLGSFQFSVTEVIRTMLFRKLTGKANTPDTTPPTVPVQIPAFLPSRETPNLRATWLGHACYLVEFPNGLRVLFDPVFEERCSPFQWLGPKRYTVIPCKIKDIPTIDAVVISHSHYDHLSYPTVMEISQRHPNCHFFAPLGNKKWFTQCGIDNMTEMDWWDELDIILTPFNGPTEVHDTGSASAAEKITARIGCLPCQHASGRGLLDQSRTLWSSWFIEAGGRKVYFAGDTGYRAVPELPDDVDDHAPEYDFPVCPAFKQIGQFRGPFDLGLIPIAAYKPRGIMSPVHADPHDAVQIFQDTLCKKALAMHWGTWVLTEEDVLEPPIKLKQALKKHNISDSGVFDICNIGESREF